MLIAITKNLLLQNRTPSERIDDGYFKRALKCLTDALEQTQHQGAKYLLVDGAFIESISTAQAFAVFGALKRYPVNLIWSPRGRVPEHIKASGICLFAEPDCVLQIGNLAIRQVEHGVTIEAFDSGISIPSGLMPPAMAMSNDDSPGMTFVELAKRGRAAHAKVSARLVPLSDDREFVREQRGDSEHRYEHVTHTEFVDKLQKHLAERKNAVASADLKGAILAHTARIDVSGDVGEYLLALEESVSREIKNAST